MKSTEFLATATILLLGVICRADGPRLMIDSGGHNAAVRSVIFTADSQSVVSAGDDKVIRLWDLKTGKTIRTFRGQIGDGDEGKVYALALSPDNRYLAAGGWLSKNLNGGTGTTIRIFDFHKGEVIAVLEGTDNVIESLAFSADGALLSSGSADNIARVWDMHKFRLVREFSGSANQLKGSTQRNGVHSVAFSADGSLLLTGSLDRVVRLWSIASGALVREMTGHTGAVVSAAFSGDGSQVISIAEDSTLRFWNTKTGASARVIPNTGIHPANLALTHDGSKILTTGLIDGRAVARVFDSESAQPVARFQQDSTITATAVSPDGRLAATAGGNVNEIYVWDLNSGSVVQKLEGAGNVVRAVGFATDGSSIALGSHAFPQGSPNHYGSLENVIWLARDPGNYHLEVSGKATDVKDYVTANTSFKDYTLTLAEGKASVLQLLKAGRVVNEFTRDETSGYRHMCYTFTPDGKIISGGLGGILSIYTTDGKRSDLVGHTGQVLAVAVSPDGQTLISGSDDETVRLWDIPSQHLLLSIFVGTSTDWMAWTAEGYYASSLNGDKYCGWNVNQGGQHAALYYSASRFQKEFYRPDVIGQLLAKRTTALALQAADANRKNPQQPVLSASDVAAILPPVLYFSNPDPDQESVTVQEETFRLRAIAVAQSNTLRITEIKVLLNGVVAAKLTVNDFKKELDMDLRLRKGPNTIKILATNGKSSAESESHTIDCTCQGTLPQNRPNLILLAIGISKYHDKDLQLEYADKDAEELEKAFQKQRHGLLFDEVNTRVITNEKATRDEILQGLDWLSKQGTPNDLRVLFLAGHGELDGTRNQYYFCSNEHTPHALAEQHDIRWDTLLDSLTRIPGKAVLMVDTCHSGAVGGAYGARGVRPAVDFTSVLKEFTNYPGVVFFAASTGTESSLENSDWQHGAFTKAILEGLSGRASSQNNMIGTRGLADWVIKRVPELTENSQHSVMWSLPPDGQPFPLFAVAPK